MFSQILNKVESTCLVEDNAEIDVHQLSTDLIDKYVRTMSIPKSDHIPHHGRHSNASRIVQLHCKPSHGIFVLLGEEMSQNRLELFPHFCEDLHELWRVLVLVLLSLHVLAEDVRRYVDALPVAIYLSVTVLLWSYVECALFSQSPIGKVSFTNSIIPVFSANGTTTYVLK